MSVLESVDCDPDARRHVLRRAGGKSVPDHM